MEFAGNGKVGHPCESLNAIATTMKTSLSMLAVLLLTVSVFAANGDATPAKAKLTPEQAEAKYTAVIDERSQKIVMALNLSNTNTAVKVHEIIMAQYRALNDWHNTNDPKIKAAQRDKAAIAQIRGSLETLHHEYLARLAENLTPEQIEKIKDEMTYGKVQFTFSGYCSQYSKLSESNKQEILRLLKEAREEAMDGGSAKEKTAIFQRYKGKINNYLSKQGIHPDKRKGAAKPSNDP